MSGSDSFDEHTLLEEIVRLEREKEQLTLQLLKFQRRPSRVIGSFLLLLGVLALLLSIVYTSYMLSFFGFGLIFWGTISLYIRPKRHVSTDLLGPFTCTLVLTIGRLLKALDLTGKGVYMPPQSPEEARNGLVFIPFKKDSRVRQIEELKNNGLFCYGTRKGDRPRGICLTSAGLGLANLIERELATSFTNVDVGYLKEKLPIMLTEILRIAEDFKIETMRNRVHVRLKNPLFLDACRQIEKSPNGCSLYGCPLCSSLATIIARSTGKPVLIEKTRLSSDGKTLEILYRISKGLSKN